MMPAMNSLPIELLVSDPYTIMLTDGGIRMPSVPPAASVPSAPRIGYPRACSDGSATVPIVAAVATDEPEVAANSAHAPMLVCSRPPGSPPSHAESAVYMRSAMPERSSSSPSSTNSGMQVSRFSLSVPQTTGAMESMNGAPKAATPPRMPTAAIDTAIGMPTSIIPSISDEDDGGRNRERHAGLPRGGDASAAGAGSAGPPLRCAKSSSSSLTSSFTLFGWKWWLTSSMRPDEQQRRRARRSRR